MKHTAEYYEEMSLKLFDEYAQAKADEGDEKAHREATYCLQIAQVYATLAHAAAIAEQNADTRQMNEATAVWHKTLSDIEAREKAEETR